MTSRSPKTKQGRRVNHAAAEEAEVGREEVEEEEVEVEVDSVVGAEAEVSRLARNCRTETHNWVCTTASQC